MISDDLNRLVSNVKNGDMLALPPSRSAPPMTATRELINRGVRNLHLVAVPTSGLQADLLIGAGCVSIVESAGITLDEFGQAPRFVDAVKKASIKLKDTTCPALVSGLQAGEKGIPFIPMRGLLGTDLLMNREDYKVIDNPMAEGGDPIVLLPAIRPDIAIIHAPLADRNGNVWIGKARELMTMAHAAHKTLVTVEKIVDEDLMENSLYAPATIPSLYISDVCVAERGAAPYGLDGFYDADESQLQTYSQMAKTPDGFTEFLSGQTLLEAAE